jgi:hypothetical protein
MAVDFFLGMPNVYQDDLHFESLCATLGYLQNASDQGDER